MGNYSIYRRLKLDGKVFDGLQKRTLALVGYEWMIAPVKQDQRQQRCGAADRGAQALQL